MAHRTSAHWLALLPLLLVATFLWVLWQDRSRPAAEWPGYPPAETQATLGSQWQSAPPLSQSTGDGPQAPKTDSTPHGNDETPVDLEALQHALALIAIDEHGQLVLDEVALVSLRRAFDEFGEAASEQSRQQLLLYIEAGLAGVTGRQAAAILDDYFSYREARRALEAHWQRHGSPDPKARLGALADLRRQHLGHTAATQLFGGEEAHQRYLLALTDLRQNPDLSTAERQAAEARLRQELRSGILLVDDRGTAAVDQLRNDQDSWQTLGLSDATRSYLTEQTLGLVSARGLATDLPARQDWQRRYDQFYRQRQLILESGLPETDKRTQIDDALRLYFSGAELDAAAQYLPPHLRD